MAPAKKPAAAKPKTTPKVLDLKDEAVQEQFVSNPNVPVVQPEVLPKEDPVAETPVEVQPPQDPIEAQREESVPDPVSVYGSPYGRRVQAKAVLYTDGISGEADHNHERAYEYSEKLQSNDPQQRSAGDVSLSAAAQELRSDRDKREAEDVAAGSRLQ